MSGFQYALLAYVVGLTLLLGYAARLWLMSRRLRKPGGSRSSADA